MIVRVIHIDVKQDSVDAFRKATAKNHEASLKEKGILRFDVLTDSTDPTRFMLYEVYRSEEATEAHKLTPHYAEWKKNVEPMMAGDRHRSEYQVVAPISEADW